MLIQGKQLTIRFALNCDNAAHHRLSNTSPPNFASRSPGGLPCPWCHIQHQEIQAWDHTQTSRIVIENRQYAMLSCIPPVWRLPDFPLHGLKNTVNLLLQGILRLLAAKFSKTVSQSLAEYVCLVCKDDPNATGMLSFDGSKHFMQHKVYSCITSRIRQSGLHDIL